MKQKHQLSSAILVALACSLLSCGPSKEEQARQEKLLRDSIEQVVKDSLRQVAVRDSLAQAKAAETKAKQDAATKDKAIADLITDMYNHDRYNDNAYLKAHCTAKLLNKLRDEYDYDCMDGDCLAGWLFRTGFQDGTGANKVISVKPLGDSWYRYDFYDEGHQGANKVKVIEVNGKLLFDDVVKIYEKE